MAPTITPFVGSAEYCYANSAAMLLASIGEAIHPATIECMTAVGAGARYWRHDGMLYFSLLPPDIALSRVFRDLGFSVEEQAYAFDAPMPIENLAETLGHGPALIGPLDMRHLTYLPGHRSAAGADHYVVVTEIDGDRGVFLHDPKGYPDVRLSFEDLEQAWRAEAVSYARQAFRFWSAPRRSEEPDRDELIARCLVAFCRAYAWEAEVPEDTQIVGAAAFERAAARLSDGDAEALTGLLIGFGLPLGARRAHDLAGFLADAAPDLAPPDLIRAKHRQARAFMAAYRSLMDAAPLEAALELRRIGDCDEAFRAAL